MDKVALLAIAGWVMVGVGLIAQAAPAMYPDRKWIPPLFFAIGVLTVILALVLGFGIGLGDSQGWLFFLPSGIALGLAAGGLLREWLTRAITRDSAWRQRTRLEIYEIACRSVGVKPKLPVPEGPALSMLRLLADAIKTRDLAAVGDIDGKSSEGGDVMTQIPHAELARFAAASGNGELLRFASDWKPGAAPRADRYLYLGSIEVDTRGLPGDRIEFSFRCFNGSAGVADVQTCQGEIGYIRKDGATEPLRALRLVEDRGGVAGIPPMGELFPIVDVGVPTELASEIMRRLDADDAIIFNFDKLVLAVELHPPVRTTVRLPVWAGVTCKKVDGRLKVINRHIAATLNIAMRLNVT